MDNDIDKMLDKLSHSKFRSSFCLKENDIKYVKDKGFKKIQEHGYDFINKRLKDISLVKDGKQTPMRGHPIFIGQHATATCCRTCLEKWYHIDKNKILSKEEIDYIVKILMSWIYREYNNYNK